MLNTLHGMKIAILVANGFEQIELVEPRKALEKVGAKIDIVSPEKKAFVKSCEQ
jgi:protease I